MNKEFSRILSLLRQEKLISQKEAAGKLGVSQALLSHYEKGIRECGLDFVVKAADFYGVSCDYLLGRTSERGGAIINIQENGDETGNLAENHLNATLLSINKKQILNSQSIVFDLLYRCQSRTLTSESSTMLMACLYKIFRIIYKANKKNPESLFSIPNELFDSYTNALIAVSSARAGCTASKKVVEDISPIKEPEFLALSPAQLETIYPKDASSLLNLIRNVESKI